MASVSASVAIGAEEEEGETSNNFNYWRVLSSISSIMFDNNNHTHKMMTGSSSCRQQQQRQQQQRGRGDRSNERYYTLTEVQTHNTLESAWITCGTTIYDVTPYITNHPGGASSILNKSGGIVDCTRDLHFHSKRAQREWKRYKVGILLT
jgi:cytochrome b involved in lipid metabolism